VTESFRWQGWLDSALPGDEPFGRSARIEIGTRTTSAEELRDLAHEAAVPINVVELPLDPSVVGRICNVDSAGPPGSAVRDETGITVEPTHTGVLLVHLGREVVGDERYLATPAPTDDGLRAD
jgi:hypothetical protein